MNSPALDTAPTAQLACQVSLPLCWHAGLQAPDRNEPLHARNLCHLHTIEALESSLNLTAAADVENELRADMQRVERKLDSLLQLMSAMLAQQSKQPEIQHIYLGVDRLRWHSEAPLIAGAGRIALYLHPCLSEPIVFPGQLQLLSPLGEVECLLDPLPDTLADAYAGYIFRRHRREIAQARHAPPRQKTEGTF